MQAFVILGDPVLFNCRGQIAEMALKHRLPTAAGGPEWVGFVLLMGAICEIYFVGPPSSSTRSSRARACGPTGRTANQV